MLRRCLVPVALLLTFVFLCSTATLHAAGPAVTSSSPGPNAIAVPPGAHPSVTFGVDIDFTTLTPETLLLSSTLSGISTASVSYDVPSRTATLTPSRAFTEGERVRVTVTSGVHDADGRPLEAYGWSFTAGTLSSRSACFRKIQELPISPAYVNEDRIAWGDYDGDGFPDLIVGSESAYGTPASLYHNEAGRGLAVDARAGLPASVEQVAWVDYDRDRLLDLLLYGLDDTAASTQRPLGAGTPRAGDFGILADATYTPAPSPTPTPFGTPPAPRPALMLYRNRGGGAFERQPGAGLPIATFFAWGDFDNDGLPDLAAQIQSSGSPRLAIYRNQGDGTFADSGFAGTYSFGPVAWGDYDNDGWLDLAATGEIPSDVPWPIEFETKVYHNDHDGTFSEDTLATLDAARMGSLTWADYDGDGFLDLLVTGERYRSTDLSSYTEVTSLFRNNGDGTFDEQAETGLPILFASAVDWGDYDNDGWTDLLLSGASGLGRTPPDLDSDVYHNNANGSFSAIGTGLPDVAGGVVGWADYDRDGRMDAMVSGLDGVESRTFIYHNEDCPPGLELHVKALPRVVRPAEPVTYTLFFENRGSGITSGLVLSDAVPAAIVDVTQTASSGAVVTPLASAGLAWQIADLAPTASGSLTLVGRIDPLRRVDGPITNTACLAGTLNGAPRRTCAAAGVDVQPADLRLSMGIVPRLPTGPGARLTYTIALTNAGRAREYGVTMSLTLPSSVQFDRWLSSSGDTTLLEDPPTEITYHGELSPGAKAVWKFWAKYLDAPGRVVMNVARAWCPTQSLTATAWTGYPNPLYLPDVGQTAGP